MGGGGEGGGLLVADDGPRRTLVLDRPATRNALDLHLLRGLTTQLQTATDDDVVRAVVITHTGASFCSGADLSAAAGAPPDEQPVTLFPALFAAIAACAKPVIALADGTVRAGGVGLFAACDLTLCTPASDFATTEVRLGLVPYVISPPFVARVGRARAAEWFLTGLVAPADRARADGLVDVVTDRPTEVADAWVAAVAAGGPRAVAATKRLLQTPPAPDQLASLSAATFASDEAREGMAARRDRRDPSWIPGGTA